MTLNRPIPVACPCCRATGDYYRTQTKRMKLPEGQVSTIYICNKCTACLAEDIAYEDQAVVRMV